MAIKSPCNNKCPAFELLSLRLSREPSLLWTGIDFRLTPAGQYVCLEASSSPRFIGFESRNRTAAD